MRGFKNNLQGRSQRAVSEGTQSSSHPVLSGVPQGTVFGPILFLIYINDLPDEASSSTVHLFADDCILYRSIKTQQDATLLQHDLNSIAQWELTWQMKFNIDKCYTMQAGRTRHNIINTYILHDHPLPITDSAKYLGITISNDLKWNKHISNITSKANSTHGILRRHPRLSSHTVKTHAYQALVRPHLEYAPAVWDHHTHCNTQKLEMVQRRAARYVCNRWHNTSSVTGMLNQLEWVPLATRRANTRLCMMYRVAHTPVGDPWTPWLTFAQRTTRGSHAWKYIPISTSHDAYKLSFLPRTIIVWNQLPSIIVAAPSIDAFRSDSSLVSYNTSTQLALVQCTHKSHRSLLYTPLALFIVLSPPRQLIMLAPADNAPSVERQLFNEEENGNRNEERLAVAGVWWGGSTDLYKLLV